MTFRAETFGTDLRVRPAQVQQAVNLYQTVAGKKRGQLIFLSGSPGSGRSDTLQAIAESLRQAQPRPKVVAGRFVNGHYTPWNIKLADLPLAKIAAAIGETISLIPGVASFIGQILQAGAANWEVVESVTKQAAHSPDMLKRLLSHTAQTQPVVYLLDDLDAAEGSGWANLLLEFAAEMHADLPILFFLTLEGQPELGEHEEDESNLLYIARHLKKRGLADWWHLPPLSREDIAAWIGSAAPGLAQYLHDATGGYPRWVIQFWHDCQERGVVTYSDEADRWQWAANLTPSLNLAKHLLDDRLKKLLGNDDPRKLEQTRALLTCAALEGRRFTAEAVAQVTGWERDDLIDFFDDHLIASEERADGILLEDGSVTIDDEQTGERTLWRYAFVSDLHWHALQSRYSLTATEQKQLSLALAHTLAALYSPEERLIARTLARLFKTGGDETAARNYQRTADYATSRAALRQQALFLMAINKDGWEKDRCRQATQLLIAAGKQMLRAYPHEETLSVFEAAHQMACLSGVTADQVYVLYICGLTLTESSNFQAAREKFQHSLEISQQIGIREGEVYTWYGLASIDLKEGNHPAAKEKFNRSLEIFRQIGDRASEAHTWNDLATIDLNEGNYPAAREKLNRSLEISRQIGDRGGEACIWHNLAWIEMNEGNYKAAREKFHRSLVIEQQIGDLAGEADNWHDLALIDLNEGNYPAAGEKFQHSSELRQKIGDHVSEAETVGKLGVTACAQGKLPEGLRLLALSFGLLQTIGHTYAQVAAENLSEVAKHLNYPPEQIEALLAEVAQEYERDRGAGLVRAAFGEE